MLAARAACFRRRHRHARARWLATSVAGLVSGGRDDLRTGRLSSGLRRRDRPRLSDAHGALRPVGAANAAIGAAMLVLPIALHAAGAPWLTSFLVGAIVAWLPALLIVSARVPAAAARPSVRPTIEDDLGHRVTASAAGREPVDAGCAACRSARPAMARRRSGRRPGGFGQLLVSVSRLSTTVVLGFLPLMVARLSSQSALPDASRWFVLATGLGLGTVGVLAVIGDPLVSWLRGAPSQHSLGTNLLSTLPAAALCPAVVAMALAIAQQRWRLIVVAWTAALAVLVAVGAIDPGGKSPAGPGTDRDRLPAAAAGARSRTRLEASFSTRGEPE